MIPQVSSEDEEQYSCFGYILAHMLTHGLFSVPLIVSGGYSIFYLSKTTANVQLIF